jgi:hypothetical protein
MSVQCPAPDCDYAGHLDAVEGHIGGVGDPLHQGVVPADLRKSLDGKASEGVAIGLLLLVVGVVLLVYLAGQEPEEEESADESVAVEGPEGPAQW